MKIWIVNQYASLPSTGTGSRHRHLARELAALGHEVVVVAARWSHLTRNEKAAEAAPQIQYFEGFRFINLSLLRYRHAHDKRRVLNWFLFALAILRLRRLLKEMPDVIIYSSPSLIGYLAAEYLAKKYKAKLVFEVRDIWPKTLVQIGSFTTLHPVIRLFQWIEDRAYRKADLVISNLPGALDHMKTRGLNEEAFEWIPNGVSLSEMQNTVAEQAHLSHPIPSDKFVVGFAGTLAIVMSIDTLLDAARLMLDSPSIVFVIVGQGMEGDRLKQKAKRYGLSNVLFIDAVPKEQVQSVVSKFDACWIGWKNSPLYDYGVAANKLFDYFYAARPVLHSFSGRFDPVMNYDAGLSVPAEDPEALVEAIERLRKLPHKRQKEMGINGKRAVTEKHDYAKLAQRLELIISQQIVGEKMKSI